MYFNVKNDFFVGFVLLNFNKLKLIIIGIYFWNVDELKYKFYIFIL